MLLQERTVFRFRAANAFSNQVPFCRPLCRLRYLSSKSVGCRFHRVARGAQSHNSRMATSTVAISPLTLLMRRTPWQNLLEPDTTK